jgi:hypothetical protein
LIFAQWRAERPHVVCIRPSSRVGVALFVPMIWAETEFTSQAINVQTYSIYPEGRTRAELHCLDVCGIHRLLPSPPEPLHHLAGGAPFLVDWGSQREDNTLESNRGVIKGKDRVAYPLRFFAKGGIFCFLMSKNLRRVTERAACISSRSDRDTYQGRSFFSPFFLLLDSFWFWV